MGFSRTTRRFALWLALAALLFSALSPAMASVLFSDRPDILARVLGVPAMPATGEQPNPCHHDMAGVVQQANPDQPSDAGSGHAAHGIFCSFCLAAGSVVTLPPVAHAIAMPIETAAELLYVGRVQPPLAHRPATQHSRAPPSLS